MAGRIRRSVGGYTLLDCLLLAETRREKKMHGAKMNLETKVHAMRNQRDCTSAAPQKFAKQVVMLEGRSSKNRSSQSPNERRLEARVFWRQWNDDF